MADCPCSNITIMQLFHELKQKFPAVPDSIVNECIRLNAHDKEACETVLSRENQSYSFPGGRLSKMAADGNNELSRPDTLQLEDTVWDFDRRLLGRQSLDSLRCSQGAAHRICKRYSEDFLNNPREHHSDDNLGALSRLSIRDDIWNLRRVERYRQCGMNEITNSESCCKCERTKVSVMSYGGSAHSAPVTPSNLPSMLFPPVTVDVTTQRHCTALSVEPSPHFQGGGEPSRPFTSVNLTLRPPSSEPQPPIDISSGSGNLTYSSCSYDPRQGYQARLQISIGPGGQGTVSAARTLTHRPSLPTPTLPLRPALSMPDFNTSSSSSPSTTSLLSSQHLPAATKALVAEQLERKERLSQELLKYRERLSSMQITVCSLESDLESRLHAPVPSLKAQKLREEVAMLQSECNRIANEVLHNAEIRHMNMETLHLGETNEEFYQNIYTGQVFPHRSTRQRLVVGDDVRDSTASTTEAGVEGNNWTCHVCTFHNHPALNKCEQCDMPRIITGSLAPHRRAPAPPTPKPRRMAPPPQALPSS